MNAFGSWTFPTGWDKSLELAVRYSYMFERMVPEDFTAFREFCGAQPADIRQWSGKPGTAQWSWLALANRAKWPIAVRSLAKYLKEKPHLWRKATAADFAVGVCFMLLACSKQAMPAKQEVHATQGLVKLAKQAGLINESSQGETQPGLGHGNLVQLGKTMFKLVNDGDGALPEAHASMCADSPSFFRCASGRSVDFRPPPSPRDPARLDRLRRSSSRSAWRAAMRRIASWSGPRPRKTYQSSWMQ